MRLLIAVGCGALLFAQEPVVFRSSTQLVEMSVVALDKRGQPVKDLQAAEIEIQDAGKRRDSAIWHYDGAAPLAVPARPATPLAAAQPGRPLAFSNRFEHSATDRHAVILVLDLLNTAQQRQLRAKSYALLYLKTMAPHAMMAIYSLGEKVAIIHDFTSDGDSLRAELERAKIGTRASHTDYAASDLADAVDDAMMLAALLGEPGAKAGAHAVGASVQTTGIMRQNHARITLQALEAIAAHLAAVPGRKTLVWVGDGIASLNFSPSPRSGGGSNWADAIRRTGERLAQHGITIYAVDSRGLNYSTNPLIVPGAARGGSMSIVGLVAEDALNGDTRWAADTLVEPSGGRAIRETNDLAAGLRRANAELEGAYTLGFYSSAKPDGKWHPVKLKCRRAGVQLMARTGYLTDSEKASKPRDWTESEWKELLANPLPPNTLAVEARCARDAAGRLGLELFVAARDLAFEEQRQPAAASIEYAIAEKQASGSFVFKAQARPLERPPNLDAPVSLFCGAWTPEPATSVVRLAVRDRRTGRLGVVDVPLARVVAQK
jgi:VWFA-related protein